MKKIILTLIILLSVNFIKAQDVEYHHGAGVSFIYAFGNDEGVNSTVGVTYVSRLVLKKLSKESSISINLTPTAAFFANINSSGSSSGSFGYEVPLSLNYNFGYGATYGSKSDFGGFLGVGYGFTSIRNVVNTNLLGSQELSSKVRGFYGEVGARFELQTPGMKKRRKGPAPLSISLYSIAGSDRGNIAGIRFIYNLS